MVLTPLNEYAVAQQQEYNRIISQLPLSSAFLQVWMEIPLHKGGDKMITITGVSHHPSGGSLSLFATLVMIEVARANTKTKTAFSFSVANIWRTFQSTLKCKKPLHLLVSLKRCREIRNEAHRCS